MNIKLELFGSSRDFSNKNFIEFNFKKKCTIKDLRNEILKFIDKKFNGNKSYKDLVSVSAFCSENNEIINNKYKINKDQKIGIIPPIGGG
jgi:molybdopterin converting factor small subunit|tara:strand:+ start:393 stop:662 length:270 start_codon:yes stop_codon:yes gene_type:complete